MTVSNAEPGVDPRYGVDLSMHSWWSAGGGAPQWIEVDLEADDAAPGGTGRDTFLGKQRSHAQERGGEDKREEGVFHEG